MADELAERRKVDRAARAKALVSDPLIAEFFTAWERDIFATWVATRDPEQRERIWNLMQATQMLQRHLEATISDGKVSEAILANMLGPTAA